MKKNIVIGLVAALPLLAACSTGTLTATPEPNTPNDPFEYDGGSPEGGGGTYDFGEGDSSGTAEDQCTAAIEFVGTKDSEATDAMYSAYDAMDEVFLTGDWSGVYAAADELRWLADDIEQSNIDVCKSTDPAAVPLIHKVATVHREAGNALQMIADGEESGDPMSDAAVERKLAEIERLSTEVQSDWLDWLDS